MKHSMLLSTVIVCTTLVPTIAMSEDNSAAEDWVEPMKTVHAKFKGAKGTFAHFGDSITISMAFWAPLCASPKNLDANAKAALELVKSHMNKECWQKWKGSHYGNDGGRTINWALSRCDGWLQSLNPEVVLIMFGSNDYGLVKLEEYEKATREVVRKCLDNGSVVILSTPPPRTGALEKAKSYAEAVRKIATEMKVPLCDFMREILRRRPEDWDGKMEKFRDANAKNVYDVKTLISRDGVHPSNSKEYENDFSEEGLSNNGFALRNCMVLMSYANVIRSVLKTQ